MDGGRLERKPAGEALQIGIRVDGVTVTAFTTPELPEGAEITVIATGLLGKLPRERDGLRREFARHHVDEGHQGKGDGDRHGVRCPPGGGAEPGQRRLEQIRQHGLAEEAEPDARQRDAELRGSDRVVESPDRPLGRCGAAAPLGAPKTHLAAPHRDQRELAGDEVGVRGHQQEDGEETEGRSEVHG